MVLSEEDRERILVQSQDPMVDRDYEDNRITDISAYFAKPVQIWSGTFATSHIWGDQLFALDLWTLFNGVTMWKDKLKGFYNFRGTVVLKLIANATPFQCGYLRLSHFPCESLMPNEAKAHFTYRDTISQTRGIYMDLSMSEVTFEIPYIAPSHYIEVAASQPVSWGKIYLHVFEILRTGTGPVDVPLTLWMSVKDAEVSGQIVPQSSGKQRRVRGNVADGETNGGLGPISGILDSGVTLASRIAAIPSLAPLARPAAWALTAAKGAASALGWSKPIVDREAMRMVSDYNWYSVNCSSGSTAQPLSLVGDNKLTTIVDAADGSQDEMSINYLKVRTAYVGDFPWMTSHTAGQTLYTRLVGPYHFIWQGTDINGNTVCTMPPFSFVGSLFALWRGSIEIIFKVIKTGYHVGTLEFSWLPGNNPSDIIVTQDTPYLYRVMLDIQKGDEICMRLPYLLAQDYSNASDAMGRFFVRVVNPLLAPATVSSTLDIIMFARGGPDLEFQWPVNPPYDPILPQGYGTTETVGDVACSTMGANEVKYDTYRSQLAIGEHVTSLLQLLKAEWNVAVSPTGDSDGFRNFQLLAHRFYAPQSKSTGGGGMYTPWLQGDYLSRIASLYAFHRGGVRYRVIDGSPGSVASWGHYRAAILSRDDATEVFTQVGSNIDRLRGNYFVGANRINVRVYQSNTRNGSLAVQVPFYHRYRYSLCRLLTIGATDDSKYCPSVSLVYAGGCGKNTVGDQSSCTMLLRSVADDFQFSYFVGVPQMTPAQIY